MAQRNPYFPTPPTAAWVRQPWSACLGFVTMMKYVAKTTVFIASNTLIGMRNLRARPSHGRRLPVQHYTACLGGTRSLWSARNFGCTREHARVSVVGGYRAAESGAGGTLGCSGSQTGESTTAAPAPVNAALSHRSAVTPQNRRLIQRKSDESGPRTLGVGNCIDFDRTKSRKPTPSCFLPALHHANASWISSFRVPACTTSTFVVKRCFGVVGACRVRACAPRGKGARGSR